MNALFARMAQAITSLHGKKSRLVTLVLTVALFILSAGAPNASIGIGK